MTGLKCLVELKSHVLSAHGRTPQKFTNTSGQTGKENNMNNKGKNGVYGIILGCVFMVAIAGFAVTSNIRNRINEAKPKEETQTAAIMNTAAPEKAAPEPEIVETKPVQAAPVQTVKKQPEKQKPEPEKEQEKELEYVAPTDGKISVPFSKNPIYSKTFDDYRSHLAIDIDAAKSTQVKSIADGKIEKIYTDPLYGITIEVRHNDKLVSKYCGLSTAELVKEGDSVKAGDVISGVGTTGAAEKEQSPHLHLEIIMDGENVDPMEYLS